MAGGAAVIMSMTGFGAASMEADGVRVAVTVRSLNHRFFELGFHAPRRLLGLEPEVKRAVLSRVARGRVELQVQATAGPDERQVVVAPPSFVTSAVDALKRLQREFALSGEVKVGDLVRLPGILEVEERAEPGSEERRQQVLDVVRRAVDALAEMRRAEGVHLQSALMEALAQIEAAAARIETRSPEEKAARGQGLLEKLRGLKEELGLDDNRLYQEAVKAAERQDVTEEVQRLRSHVSQARQAVQAEGPCGKRLDFLAQEMAREAATIGSKVSSAPLAHEAISVKNEVERFREQVQNVE